MKRIEKLSPFIVMEIVKKASSISDCIHFEVGQPDIKPPESTLKAFQEAVSAGDFPYTESFGLPPLRKKIAGFYKERYGVNVDPEKVMLTVGTSGAFLVAYAVTLDMGDRLAFTDPGYPCYKNFSYVLDIEPVTIPVGSETRYQMTPELLSHYPDIKAVQVSSPSNPTGNVYSTENFRNLINYCEDKNIRFISDEIYHGLVYSDVKENTACEFSENAVVINGFSKYFCMPGARLGWVILPDDLVRPAEMVMQNLFISAPTISQMGALGSFDSAFLADYRAEYQKRRDYLYGELKDIFKIDILPEGAFYIWADASKYTDDCYSFAMELLENIHIAVTPGVDFGTNGTNRYIRFAYTRNIEHMSEGIKRLKQYLKV